MKMDERRKQTLLGDAWALGLAQRLVEIIH